MKGSKTLGFLIAVVAVIVLITGIFGAGLRSGTGPLVEKYTEASERGADVQLHAKAAEKTAPSAVKKAESASAAAGDAATKTAAALESMNARSATIADSDTTGDEFLDTLRGAIGDAVTVLDTGDETIRGSVGGIESIADSMLLDLYKQDAESAVKAVNAAEDKLGTANDGIRDVYTAIGSDYATARIEKTEYDTPATLDDCFTIVNACIARAEELGTAASVLTADAAQAQTDAGAVAAADKLSVQDRFLLLLHDNWMGFLFTALLLAAAAVALLFFAKQFAEKWRSAPLFSTFIALLVLIAIQTYALGFNFESIGAWISYWYGNVMNVLRANASVGMIALAMTFVIISGGIDLAVGSTLTGVATLVMCLIDIGPGGLLTGLGITGLPAYLIACAAGIVLGLLFGSATGLMVTKGKIPPFIVTLGMMQIIRSVAQYFTKSYTPEVPKEFQSLANTVIGGQMLLPIVYWLVLAVVLHIVSKHTAFGRHVYAVGSNERSTMLSGINTDKVKIKVYALTGFVVSLAAILQVSRLRGVDVSSAGSGYEMNAIAAVVVGGTSMAGGKGSILGTVMGMLIIGIMNNLLVLLSVDSFLSNAFTGAIVIAAVLMQRKEKAA